MRGRDTTVAPLRVGKYEAVSPLGVHVPVTRGLTDPLRRATRGHPPAAPGCARPALRGRRRWGARDDAHGPRQPRWWRLPPSSSSRCGRARRRRLRRPRLPSPPWRHCRAPATVAAHRQRSSRLERACWSAGIAAAPSGASMRGYRRRTSGHSRQRRPLSRHDGGLLTDPPPPTAADGVRSRRRLWCPRRWRGTHSRLAVAAWTWWEAVRCAPAVGRAGGAGGAAGGDAALRAPPWRSVQTRWVSDGAGRGGALRATTPRVWWGAVRMRPSPPAVGRRRRDPVLVRRDGGAGGGRRPVEARHDRESLLSPPSALGSAGTGRRPAAVTIAAAGSCGRQPRFCAPAARVVVLPSSRSSRR